jgi:hypothetical protein
VPLKLLIFMKSHLHLKITTITCLSAFVLIATPQTQAASVNVNGAITGSLQNRLGENLPDGSVVEVGYFLGVNITTPVGDYTPNNLWDTFTVIRTVQTSKIFNFFDAGADLSGAAFDSDADFDALPRRVGVRFTDSASGDFNIYTIDGTASELELAVGTPPAFGTGEADLSLDGATANVAWLGTPFRTTVAVPEPSTSLSALLGLGLLIGARRRK